jgi:hypothetical protein
MKTKTIKLSKGRSLADGFCVLQITDSTEFDPGQWLKRIDVDALCAAKDWKVTIVGRKP